MYQGWKRYGHMDMEWWTCSSFAQLTQNYLNNNPSSKKAEDQKAYNWTIEKELKIQKFDFIWYWVVL